MWKAVQIFKTVLTISNTFRILMQWNLMKNMSTGPRKTKIEDFILLLWKTVFDVFRTWFVGNCILDYTFLLIVASFRGPLASFSKLIFSPELWTFAAPEAEFQFEMDIMKVDRDIWRVCRFSLLYIFRWWSEQLFVRYSIA